MVFEVPLADKKIKPHQVTALHLVAGFALLACSAVALLINNTVVEIPGSAPAAVQAVNIKKFDAIDIAASILMSISIVTLIAALFRNKWLRSPKVNITFRVLELLSSATIAIYLLTIGYNVPAAVFGLMAATFIFSIFWEKDNKKPLTVSISDDGIHLPVTSRRRNIAWREVNTLLLRHGTLTINCLDNRLYQWVTAPNDIDTEIFDAYCNQQIEAAMKHRRNDGW